MTTLAASLVRRTPLVASPIGGVWLKLECLQRTNSFKLRGAAARLDAMSADERQRGVVAASAGNHGQGIALCGRHLGIHVEVVVPATCPPVKRDAIRALGAEVIDGGPTYDDAEHTAKARAAERGAVYVSPFDDEHVIRGNGGTLADEILAQAPDVTRVIAPVGGGGLIGGLAAVLAPRGVKVVGVQPAGNCAMHRSLELGRALTVYDGEPTLAEGCEGPVAERTFALCRQHGVETALVTEDAISRAIAWAYRECGVVAEPSAAVALAGVLEGVVPVATGRTVIVISGGNIEPDLLDKLLG